MLWALGWSVTTSAGIDVESQYVVFGIFGSLSVAAVQASVLHRFFGVRGGSWSSTPDEQWSQEVDCPTPET